MAQNVWLQKTSIPPPWKEFEILGKEVGRLKTLEILEGRGIGQSIKFLDVLQFSID